MSCKNERIDLCMIAGVADALVITISDSVVDPAGYEFVIGDNTYTGEAITAVAAGDDVLVTCPILADAFEVGVYDGYFKTLTMEQGSYLQVKLQLTVTAQYGN